MNTVDNYNSAYHSMSIIIIAGENSQQNRHHNKYYVKR